MTSIFGSTGKDQTAAAANADPLQKTPVLATLVNTYMYDDSLVVRNLDYILALVRQTNLFASTSADPAVVAAHEAAVSKWAIGVAKLAQSRTSASVRYAGVVLVHATIEKCGSVAGVAVNWERILQSALRPLNSPSTPSDVGVQLEAIKALVALYVRCLEVPDMKRELIDASMPRLLEALVQMATPTDATGPNVLYSPVLIQPALLALQTLVRIFPSLARQKRMSEKISALCESLLGSSDAAVRSCAIRCLVTTCEVGNKPNATAAWRVIIMRAIATMHAAIDRLASTVREDIRSPIYIRDTKSLPYPGLSEFSEDDLEAIPLAARRVQALAASVADILDTSMRFAVSVPIHHIVSIVSRLASLNSSVTITETATQMAHRLFVTTIPNIHQNGALLLIQALTAACRSHALPYLGQMMRDVHIILDTASSNAADGVRVAAYETMTTMLHTFGLGAAHGLRETFYASLLSDLEGARRPLAIGAFGGISAEQPGSKRRKTNGGGNNAASNAAALLVASPSNESEGVRGSTVTSDGMTWSASHLAALSLVHTLIQDSSSAIPPNVRVSVDRLIIQQVLRGSHTKRHGNECADERIMAIKCLVAAIGSPSTALSLQAGGGSGGGSNGGGMMLPHARRALTAGLTDGSAKVRMVCRSGLEQLDLIVHPRAPPQQLRTVTIVSHPAGPRRDHFADSERPVQREQPAPVPVAHHQPAQAVSFAPVHSVTIAEPVPLKPVYEQPKMQEQPLIPTASSFVAAPVQPQPQVQQQPVVPVQAPAQPAPVVQQPAVSYENLLKEEAVNEAIEKPVPEPAQQSVSVANDDGDNDDDEELPDLVFDDDDNGMDIDA